MKWKFTNYLCVSAILAAGAAGAIQVFAQSGTDQFRPQNSGQYGLPTHQTPPIAYPFPIRNIVTTNTQSAVPIQGMPGHGPQRFTIVNKEGTIERINKEPGDRLSKEEFDQINETRQRIHNAVSQIRSPDADESKRKDAKELIAKYLKAEFQADQESRREQVERIEKQVEQLKKQLSKRNDSQDKLIELRMQLLENDASGLSFPDAWGNISGPPQGFYVGPSPVPPSGPGPGINAGPYYPNQNYSNPPSNSNPPSFPQGATLPTPSSSYPAPKKPNPDEGKLPSVAR